MAPTASSTARKERFWARCPSRMATRSSRPWRGMFLTQAGLSETSLSLNEGDLSRSSLRYSSAWRSALGAGRCGAFVQKLSTKGESSGESVAFPRNLIAFSR